MKYIEFYRFLENNTKEKLELTYEDIEKIIGEKLPNSANNHSAYFSNSLSHPISKIWLELGYTQTKLELGKYLILEKVKEKEVMNISKLDKAIKNFLEKKETNKIYYEEIWNERKERKEFYQTFTKEKILAMSEETFFEYIAKLWSMLIWGNKQYVINKLIEDNGFDKLKRELVEFLYGKESLEKRWDTFLKSVKGLGPATMSELLTYINPQEYVIFNKTTILCFTYLDIPNMPKYNYQYTGKKYVEICKIAKRISEELKKIGEEDYDLLAVDYFLWDEVLPYAESKEDITTTKKEIELKNISNTESKSLHDEVKEKLEIIGKLLGFESRSEVKITTGAIVDVVWEARIGNMGKAIYVFEVQSKGSIDSLILNLKKAQSNPAVQAVVAVSDESQLSKIIKESAGVIEEKSLRTWDIEDVIKVYDSLVRAHESINKLSLVPESF